MNRDDLQQGKYWINNTFTWRVSRSRCPDTASKRFNFSEVPYRPGSRRHISIIIIPIHVQLALANRWIMTTSNIYRKLLRPWNRWNEIGSVTFRAISHTFISTSVSISISNISSFLSFHCNDLFLFGYGLSLAKMFWLAITECLDSNGDSKRICSPIKILWLFSDPITFSFMACDCFSWVSFGVPSCSFLK
jgi:hypothetical protein